MMKRRIEYMRLDEFISHFHPDNPKAHDIPAIEASINLLGFKESPLIDETTGYVAAGHGRALALWAMHEAGKALPRDMDEADDGMWMIPVERGISFNDEDELRAYLVASNQLTSAGGWNIPQLEGLMLTLQDTPLFELTGFDADMLGDMGISFGSPQIPAPGTQAEPSLPSERFIEIYCSDAQYELMQATLKKWSGLADVTINIS